MDNSIKPVPIPRRIVTKQESSTEIDKNPILPKPENGNVFKPDNDNFAKPVPLPRKIIQRLNSANEKRKSKKQEKELNASLRQAGGDSNDFDISDDAKRGTINLFQRSRNRDPFDSEFETSLKDAQLLTGVHFTSPLDDIPAESRSSFAFSTASSNSSSACGEDYYSDPPSQAQPVSKFTNENENKSASRLPSVAASTSSGQNSLCGETNNCYQNTEGNEAVYEPISSYSSSSSTSGSNRNDYSSLPSSSNATSDHVLSKRSTVPVVGMNGKPDFVETDLSFFSKRPYERLNDDNNDPAYFSTSKIDTEEKLGSESNRNSISSNNSSLKSNITRNPSNASSRSNKSKVPHEYDDVAIENGNVVFMDNETQRTSDQSNSTTKTNSSNSITSRSSVVMEFDPLFVESNSSKTESFINSAEDLAHRYEFVDGEMESTENEPSKFNESQLLSLTPPSASNPEYLPIVRKPSIDAEKQKKIDEEQEEYESIAPIPDLKPKRSLFRKSASPVKEENKGSSDDGKGNDGESAISQPQMNTFFRRLSHKIRLVPIREETSKNLRSSTVSVISCNKCFEEHTEGTKCKFIPVANSDVVYSSNLFRPSGGIKKEFTKRFGVLSKGKITFQNEKSVALDEISLTKVGCVSKKTETRGSSNPQDLHLFVLHFASGKTQSQTLGCGTEHETCCWMQKYIEVYCSTFPHSVISSYERGGWCFIKEGLTNDWNPSWLILKDRSLFYCCNSSDTHFEMDLRKARSIVLSTKESDHMCPFVDNSEVLIIDMSVKIFYIQTENGKVTSGWVKVIQEAAKRNGTRFEEMQLTIKNVPVIVNKCIDFLYAHGTLAEGIYRQSGANSRITQLLADFQKDAWSVQISAKEFSVHDVAGTLKRFFRTLPEPLVTSKLYDRWIQASGLKVNSKKLETYQQLLEELPDINYNILKKLICHLYAVHELHEKNLMPLINLAPIWGPTLMNVDTAKAAESSNSYKIACAECEVVKDLIENYYSLFQIDPQERDKEKKMQDALEIFHVGSTKRKCSGDLKIWIYILDKDETSAMNITLSPTSTAISIVQLLCRMAQLRNCDNLFLHEVVCEGDLQRPLHPSEKVIETVLRWSIWDIEERKNSYLILKANTLYPALVPYAKDPKAVYGEMKYADSKSKTFKKYEFTFSGAILKYFKDAKASSELGSWKIEDIVWYLGSEQKRTTPTKWAVTFVKKNYPFKRSKEEPFFGNVICCVSEEELHKWIGAMVVGEHPAGLYPSVIV